MNWLSNEESITEPSVFAVSLEGKTAVICFANDFYDHLKAAFELADARDAPGIAGGLKGTMSSDVVLYHCCFGAPAAGLHLEGLIASGVDRVIMAGSAGSISPTARVGSIVLPTWGIREEGTSYHYLPAETDCRPSADLLQEIRGVMGLERVSEGGVWTTDAALRETKEKVKQYAKRGVLAVDMECTALMAIALYRNVQFAAVLVITDELFEGEWRRGFRSKGVERAKKIVAERIRRVLK
ncbi:phosphorylase [Candidatus Thorarchaeota archaeon]|nr:MAG: phosphorylase [Candidatus Thorarchaeota archaeon]